MKRPIFVLVIDDDDVDRERVRRMLSSRDYEFVVTEIGSATEAIALLRGSRFDCIILDFHLGSFSGLDLLGQINHQVLRFCPVIMVTGLGDESIAASAIKAGITDYLIKKLLSGEQLIQTILIALHRADQDRRVHQLAFSDGLTHLATRTVLTDRLHEAIAESIESEQFSALMYVDLDQLKPINDTYGHSTGDAVLVETASRLKRSIRLYDIAARVGGDEFAVLLINLRSEQEIHNLVIRLREIISRPIRIGDGHELNVSASIGVTLIRDPALNVDVVLRQADHSMYLAKNSGRNQVRFFDSAQEARIRGERRLQEEVAQALAANEFVLYYQPKIDLASRHLIGFESLIRWKHPTKGVLLPAEFARMLDDDVLAVRIGDWSIRQVMRQIDQWRQVGFEYKISVNVSPKQIQRKDFIPGLRTILSEYPLVPSSLLELEIVETAQIKDFAAIHALLQDCHALGVSVALDDFGTGYSSLTYLRQLPIDLLKIDKSFVINMLSSKDDSAIVSAVVSLCNIFGRDVIAEGVETEAHIAKLLELGCHLGQGFGISMPLPAEAVLAWQSEWLAPHAWPGELR